MPDSSFCQSYELTRSDLIGLRHLTRFQGRDHRRILRCICLDAGGRMVACDGARMLIWPSRGLVSLAAPVILESVTAESVPEGDGAALVIDEEEATLHAGDGAGVTFPLHPGPYVRYEEAVGLHPPGSVSVVADTAELMACMEEVEPFLRPRHQVASPGWAYNPLVEVHLSGPEGRLTLRTGRDQGFARVEEAAPDLDREGPEWSHSVSCPVQVKGLEGESFRVGVNHDYLKAIAAALGDVGEQIRIRPGQGCPPALHFDVRDGRHSALLMPMRMGSREPQEGASAATAEQVSQS